MERPRLISRGLWGAGGRDGRGRRGKKVRGRGRRDPEGVRGHEGQVWRQGETSGGLGLACTPYDVVQPWLDFASVPAWTCVNLYMLCGCAWSAGAGVILIILIILIIMIVSCQPGLGWGDLPVDLQPRWRAYDCDYYARQGKSPSGPGAEEEEED
jgi:hypothetical protein